MRICCISDSHNRHSEILVPPCDLLIHAGDATARGRSQELLCFNKWVFGLGRLGSVLVPGNHDLMFEDDYSHARQLVFNTTILVDREVNIGGLRIYGSPWQPEFCNWGFNLPRGEDLKKRWDLIPTGIDILVTHGPPYGVLDCLPQYGTWNHLGCEELQLAVNRIKPKLHVFGHIHYGHGYFHDGTTLFVNAAVCTEEYEPNNRPILIDYTDGKMTVVEA